MKVPVGTGVIAAPVTYDVDGQQYVSIAVGWAGTYGLSAHHSESEIAVLTPESFVRLIKA